MSKKASDSDSKEELTAERNDFETELIEECVEEYLDQQVGFSENWLLEIAGFNWIIFLIKIKGFVNFSFGFNAMLLVIFSLE